jgi:hypothetical protein
MKAALDLFLSAVSRNWTPDKTEIVKGSNK